ncbi:uncharacterized protein LOC134815417 [Bolinopsis microptera]|uniref:uncharacterized protein LOC134815417 n=1 Tax=Bolinopsis microptera TaxID=2820187 RepID=UPI003079FDEE
MLGMLILIIPLVSAASNADPNKSLGTLNLTYEMCGMIRPIGSNQCVTVPGNRDDTLILTSDCAVRNVFCYNSTSRFIKPKDDDKDCVASEDNRLLLKTCEDLELMKWLYSIEPMIKQSEKCWKQSASTNANAKDIGVVAECDEECHFQLIKSSGDKTHEINLTKEKIDLRFGLKPGVTKNNVLNYRCQVVLNFFSDDKESSIGLVRVHMRSFETQSTINQSVTVVNWEDSSTSCTKDSTDHPALKKLHTGEANLILSVDTLGNLRMELDIVNETFECESGFLKRATKMVVQWVNLAKPPFRNKADEFFTVELRTITIPVHGRYTEYGSWSECSKECGVGTKTRTRTCTNPALQHGGDECVGDAQDQTCNTHPCPSKTF